MACFAVFKHFLSLSPKKKRKILSLHGWLNVCRKLRPLSRTWPIAYKYTINDCTTASRIYIACLVHTYKIRSWHALPIPSTVTFTHKELSPLVVAPIVTHLAKSVLILDTALDLHVKLHDVIMVPRSQVSLPGVRIYSACFFEQVWGPMGRHL